MRLKLHIAETEDFSPKVMALLNQQFTVTTGSVNKDALKQKLAEVDIFWFRLAYRLDGSVIDENTCCKYFVSPVTGIDHIDENLCKQFEIKIICLRGETDFLKEVRATAEHTMLLAMMLMRNAGPALEDVKAANWRRDLFRGFELYKKKIGIIGYGRLGSIVANYFHAFGAEVGYFDIVDKKAPVHFKKYDSMESCIMDSDIISVHIPYNKSTHQLFDKSVFQLFDNSKWLINTSRGGIFDEAALLVVLKNNQLAGAALDVLYGEPEISAHPLIAYARESRNLIITPHIGGCTFESFEKTEMFIYIKLKKTLINEKIYPIGF